MRPGQAAGGAAFGGFEQPPDPHPVYGGAYPAMIWGAYMRTLLAVQPVIVFPEPRPPPPPPPPPPMPRRSNDLDLPAPPPPTTGPSTPIRPPLIRSRPPLTC